MAKQAVFYSLISIFLFSWMAKTDQDKIDVLYSKNDIDVSNIRKRTDFKPYTDYNLGLNNGIYWIKIKKLPEVKKNIIRIKSHHVTSAIAITSDGHHYRAKRNTLFPTFLINLPAIDLPVIIKLQLDEEAYFPLDFISEISLQQTQQSTLFGFGLFYGALFFIVIMNIILFSLTGEKNFWTYAALLFFIGVALAFRDNLPYLFDWKGKVVLNLELLSHILIGVFGGFFAYSFIELRHKNHKIGKFFVLGFGLLSCMAMFAYWIFAEFIFYALADLFIFLAIVSLWFVSFSLRIKSVKTTIVFAIYAINIYFILDFLILHNFGITLLNLSSLIIKIGIVVDMIILSIAIFTDWQELKKKSNTISDELKIKMLEVDKLSQYKRQDDLNDDYLQNLIDTYNLSNREVKLLQMLSAGEDKSTMTIKLNINKQELEEAIIVLYDKLGIGDGSDTTIKIA